MLNNFSITNAQSPRNTLLGYFVKIILTYNNTKYSKNRPYLSYFKQKTEYL